MTKHLNVCKACPQFAVNSFVALGSYVVLLSKPSHSSGPEAPVNCCKETINLMVAILCGADLQR